MPARAMSGARLFVQSSEHIPGRRPVAALFAVMVLASCGGGTKVGPKVIPAGTTHNFQLSAPIGQGWPSEWCEASVGMTKGQLYQIMGPPTADSTVLATWTAPEYQFSAMFNADRSVRQLDIISGSADCATTRM